ncbi:MAG: tyrosine-type recombinase/integrase [Chloroflexi bacterium]|nr:tyrosine-type recombinase/integrase [Chloroflexota bacterium]
MLVYRDDASPWEKALYAFLSEKHKRSGSLRTVQGYSGMLTHFFGSLGKPPDRVISSEVFTWAHSPGLSGKAPSSTTVGARIACLSSFYRFLIRMDLVHTNPCDRLERPKARESTPRGLTGEDVKQLLAVVPETKAGLRDRAIILTLVFTGRRRTEVLSLKAGDLDREGGTVFYRYCGKGGKTGRRELPRPAVEAIERMLGAWGRRFEDLTPEAPLWPSHSGTKGLTSGTFYGNLRKYLRAAGLPLSGVHVFRHTAAKLRRDAGESVEEVSRFLDHSNLGVTTVYLRRLEGQQDRSWDKVAAAIGL